MQWIIRAKVSSQKELTFRTIPPMESETCNYVFRFSAAMKRGSSLRCEPLAITQLVAAIIVLGRATCSRKVPEAPVAHRSIEEAFHKEIYDQFQGSLQWQRPLYSPLCNEFFLEWTLLRGRELLSLTTRYEDIARYNEYFGPRPYITCCPRWGSVATHTRTTVRLLSFQNSKRHAGSCLRDLV